MAFFADYFYKGACSVLGVGNYPNAKAMRIRNDSISSIKVGSKVTVTVCKHSTKGRVTNAFSSSQQCLKITRSLPTLQEYRVGSDNISPAQIFPKFGGYTRPTNGACKPSLGQEAVAVYEHPDYKGSCRLLLLGRYNNSNEMRFKNDAMSSIEFGDKSKVNIAVFSGNNNKGRVYSIQKSVSNLFTSPVGDNKVSSARVYRKK